MDHKGIYICTHACLHYSSAGKSSPFVIRKLEVSVCIHISNLLISCSILLIPSISGYMEGDDGGDRSGEKNQTVEIDIL